MVHYRNILRDLFQKTKFYLRIIKGSELFFPLDIYIRKHIYGNYQAEWCIAANTLNTDSIVYSIGVGTDISFDLTIIEKYKCRVFAFDPTPRSINWLKNQALPETFIFSPYGISNENGNIIFYPPADTGHVSFSIEPVFSDRQNGISLPVKRLNTIMEIHGHQKINLLKMDIEGSEYNVIKDILDSSINIEQILVEFHHRFDKEAIDKTRNVVQNLKKAGYKIFYISPTGEEYSFIKGDSLN